MEYSPELNSAISNTSRVVQDSTSPVIVVGLPRSGSSYLAHVLSCLKDWFVFDDLYPYQKAAALSISSSLDLAKERELLREFINSLTWQLRAKIKYEQNFSIPNVSWDDTFEMEDVLLKALDQEPLTWPQVLEEWMMRLTLSVGKERWGYKTPQDFMHMDELSDLFPGVKFIYILRDPRKMMRSFKNLPQVKTHGSQDGESRQYHPLVYALYWKKAYEEVQAFAKRCKAPVETVKFEDLVESPEKVAGRLAEFLNTEIVGNVALEKGNTSFKNTSPRELTNTETLICEKIAGSAMQSIGYPTSNPKPKLSDVVDLLNTSTTFSIYQIQRIISDKKARASVTAFIKRLISP